MAFSIVGDIQLRAPNLGSVASQIRSSLAGITAPINVSLNPSAISNLTRATGVINTMTTSMTNLATAATSAQQAVNLLAAASRNLQNVTAQFNNANQATQNLARNLRPVADAAEAAGRRFLGFAIVTGTVLSFVAAVKQGITEAIQFQRELTKFTQVGVATAADLRNISNEVTRLATTYGVSSRELLQSATTLRQAGFSISQVKDALESLAQTSLAPSFDSQAKTVEGLIAVMSQFKLSIAGGKEALASINAVSNAYAVESRDLIEAVKRSGGAFASAGGNINEFIGAFTSVRATTRESAESIATGLRTIFARFERGRTVDSLRELGIQLRFTREEAEALGQVNLTDQFVGPAEAIRRISDALAQVRQTDPRYASVVEELGGYRQISRLIPLLQNVTQAQEAYAVAQGGSLSIALAADQAQNNYATSLKKVQEQFLALSRDIISSPAFTQLISQLTSLTSLAISFVDKFQGILPILGTLAAFKVVGAAASFTRGLAGFARGGPVPGSGSGDTVPAMLEPGEFVLKKQAAQSIGHETLSTWNKYAGGGSISPFDLSSVSSPPTLKKNTGLPEFAFMRRQRSGFQTQLSKYIEENIDKTPGVRTQIYSLVQDLIYTDRGQELLSRLPQDSRILGSGIQALALKTPQGDVARLARYGHEQDPFVGNRPNIPGILQSHDFSRVDRLAYERLPLVDVAATQLKQGRLSLDEGLEQAQLLRNLIRQGGYEATDLHLGNFGRDSSGQNQLFDLGFLRRLSQREVAASLAPTAKFASGGEVSQWATIPGGIDRPYGVVNSTNVLETLKKIQGNIGFNLAGSGIVSKIFGTNKGVQLADEINTDYFGFFDPKTQTIGLNASTIPDDVQLMSTLAHEFGHAVDYNPRNRRMASNDLSTVNGKLAANFLSSRNRFDKISADDYYKRYSRPEGFADFFAKYATSDKPNAPYFREFPKILAARGVPRLPGFAAGGPVGTDTVPAMLTPGEFVFSRNAVQNIGVNTLHAMNARGFADGGYVSSSTALTLANRDIVPRAEPFQNYRGLFDALVGKPIPVVIVGISPQVFGNRLIGESPNIITPTRRRLLTDDRDLTSAYATVPQNIDLPANQQNKVQFLAGNAYRLVGESSGAGPRPRVGGGLGSAFDFAQQSDNINLPLSQQRAIPLAGSPRRRPDVYGFAPPVFGDEVFGPPRPTRFQRFQSNLSSARDFFANSSIGPYAGIGLAIGAGALGNYSRPTDAQQSNYTTRSGLSGTLEGVGFGATVGLSFGGGPLGLAIGAVVGGLTGLYNSLNQAADDIRKVKLDDTLSKLNNTIEQLANNQFISSGQREAAVGQINTLNQGILEKTLSETSSFFGLSQSSPEEFRKTFARNQHQLLAPLDPGFTQIFSRETQQFGRGLAGQPGFAELSANDLRTRVNGQVGNLLGGGDGLNRAIFDTLVQLRTQVGDNNARENLTNQIQRELLTAAQREALRQRGQNASADTERGSLTFSRLATAVDLAIHSLQNFNQQIEALDNLFSGQTQGIRAFSREDIFSNFGSGQVGAALAPYSELLGGQGNNIIGGAAAYDQFRQALPDLIREVTARGDLGRDSAETTFRNLAESQFGRNNHNVRGLIATVGSNLGSGDFLTEERRRLLRANPDKFATETLGQLAGGIEEPIQQFERSLRELADRVSSSFAKIEQRMGKIIDLEEKRSQTDLTGRRTLSQLEANVRLRPSEGPLPVLEEQQVLARRNAALALNSGLAPGLGNNPSAIGAALANIQSEIPNLINQRNQLAPGTASYFALDQRIVSLQGNAGRLNQALENLTNTAQTTASAQRRLGEIQADRDARLSFGTRFVTSDVNERNRTIDNLRLIQQAGQAGSIRGFAPSQQSRIISELQNLGEARITVGGQERVAREFANELTQELIPGIGLAPGRADEERQLIQNIAKAFGTAKAANNELIRSLKQNQQEAARLLTESIAGQNNLFLQNLTQRLLENDRRSIQAGLGANALQQGQINNQTRGLNTLSGLGVNVSNQAALNYLTSPAALSAIETYRTQDRIRTNTVEQLSNLNNIQFQGNFNADTDLGRPQVRAARLLQANAGIFNQFGIANPESLVQDLVERIRVNLGRQTGVRPYDYNVTAENSLRDILRQQIVNRGAAAVGAQNQARGEFIAGGGTQGVLDLAAGVRPPAAIIAGNIGAALAGGGLGGAIAAQGNQLNSNAGITEIRSIFENLRGIDLNQYNTNLRNVNTETANLTRNLQNVNAAILQNNPQAIRGLLNQQAGAIIGGPAGALLGSGILNSFPGSVNSAPPAQVLTPSAPAPAVSPVAELPAPQFGGPNIHAVRFQPDINFGSNVSPNIYTSNIARTLYNRDYDRDDRTATIGVEDPEVRAARIRFREQTNHRITLINDPNTFSGDFGVGQSYLGLPNRIASVYASGGPVGGIGSGDTVPAMLSPGEFVFSRPAVAAAGGLGTLSMFNNAARFATGGPVTSGGGSFNLAGIESFVGAANSLSTTFNSFSNALRPFVTALERFPSRLTGSFQHRLDVNINGGEFFAQIEPLTRKLITGEVRKQLTKYIEQNMPDAGLPN